MRKIINHYGIHWSVLSTLARLLTVGVSSILLIAGSILVSESPAGAAQITPTNLASAAVGAAYTSSTLTVATAGMWSISAGALPAGLAFTSLASATTDTISGTPTGDGTYDFTFTVTDAVTPATYSQSYTLVVTGINPSPLTSPILVNTAFNSGTLSVATAGTWAVSAGALPAGLALASQASSTTDSIAGTPTTNGSYTFTITVTDAITPETYVQQYTLVVASQIPQPTLKLLATIAALENPITLITTGGAGTSAPTFAVTNGTATGCAISGTSLTATSIGTCIVTASEAATSTYLVANAKAATYTFVANPVAPPAVVATRVTGTAIIGKTVVLKISGRNFTGKPTVTSTNPGTRFSVAGDTGSLLTLRVTATAKAHKGIGTLTITELNGTSCKIKYVTR